MEIRVMNNEVIIDGVTYVKKEETKKEENYCVDGYKAVRCNTAYNDLCFRDDCKVCSTYSGDGISIKKKYIKHINESPGLGGEDVIHIRLKGTKATIYSGDKILYEAKK